MTRHAAGIEPGVSTGSGSRRHRAVSNPLTVWGGPSVPSFWTRRCNEEPSPYLNSGDGVLLSRPRQAAPRRQHGQRGAASPRRPIAGDITSSGHHHTHHHHDRDRQRDGRHRASRERQATPAGVRTGRRKARQRAASDRATGHRQARASAQASQRSSREVQRSTFARFFGLFDFRLLQQYLPVADSTSAHLVRQSHTARCKLRNGLEIDPSAQAAVQKNWVTYHARFARSKIVVAGPPADECCSMNRSSSPLITNERLLFLPSQFGNVARSI